jgi:hypothetical protein
MSLLTSPPRVAKQYKGRVRVSLNKRQIHIAIDFENYKSAKQ